MLSPSNEAAPAGAPNTDQGLDRTHLGWRTIVNESMPDQGTIEELRDLINEIGGGTDQERAAFRQRKDDLLARLFPTEDES